MAKPRIIRLMEERLAREGKTSKLVATPKKPKISLSPRVHITSAQAFESATIGKGVKTSVKYVTPLTPKKIKPSIQIPQFTSLERRRIYKYSRKYHMKVYSMEELEQALKGSEFSRKWAENIINRYKTMAQGQYDKRRQTQYETNYRNALVKANAPMNILEGFDKWVEDAHTQSEWADLPDIKDLEYPIEILGVEAVENWDWWTYLLESFSGTPHTLSKETIRRKLGIEIKAKKNENRRKRRQARRR